MVTYKIVRNYFNSDRATGIPGRRVIKTGLTLEEAQAYCRDPETSSKTCTRAAGRRRTKRYGPWFDGYTEE
jgi:hypothetical protein